MFGMLMPFVRNGCAQMKRRIRRKVVKRWQYFMRWKKIDRVLLLYLRRLVWNPQIVSHIAGFAAQTPKIT